MRSIRRNLLLALMGTMGAAILLAASVTYRVARDELNEVFDYHLRQIALSLRDQDFRGTLPVEIPGAGDFDFVIRVWDRAGVTVYYSRPHHALPELARLGYSTVNTPEGAWRLFAIQSRDQTIEVAQPLGVRRDLAAAAALRTLTPFFVLLPVLGMLVWLIIRYGLRPLDRITQSVLARSPSSLDPLREENVPEEVQPLLRALNHLLERLTSALETQRAFVADAAHELRTPLAALQLQAQLVEKATLETDRAAAMAELKHGLQRASHAVSQLLTLARQEPGAGEYPFEPVRLAEAARSAIADHVPLAEDRQVDLGLSLAEEGICVLGNAGALHVLMANLIGNAVRYTPHGGKVDVAVGEDNGRPVLEVSDSGPGIPAGERERVFGRFYRRDTGEEAGVIGSGLGLAIVRTIAERHGATVSLGEADAGGLRVRVSFPPLSQS